MRYIPWSIALYELIDDLQTVLLAAVLFSLMSIEGIALSLLLDRNRQAVVGAGPRTF